MKKLIFISLFALGFCLGALQAMAQTSTGGETTVAPNTPIDLGNGQILIQHVRLSVQAPQHYIAYYSDCSRTTTEDYFRGVCRFLGHNAQAAGPEFLEVSTNVSAVTISERPRGYGVQRFCQTQYVIKNLICEL